MIRLLALAAVVLLAAPCQMFAADEECPEARARAALALASASVPVRHVTRATPAPVAPATAQPTAKVQVCDGETCRTVPATAAGCEFGCKSCSGGSCSVAGNCGMQGCAIAAPSQGISFGAGCSGGSCSSGGRGGFFRRR